MTAEQPHYLAFMLRLWQAGSEHAPVWRASLESPRTGERQAFASLDALIAFIGERCAPDYAPNTPDAPLPYDEAPADPSAASIPERGTEESS